MIAVDPQQKMETTEPQIYRFENFEADIPKGRLKREGKELRLRQKTFHVLAYLIEHRDSDVAKDQIIRDVWHEAAVVDDVLVQSVTDIRRALGDDTRNPRFIRTIPKFGYRFIGDVETSPAALPTVDKNPIEEKAENISAIAPRWPKLIAAIVLVAVIIFGLGLTLQSILAGRWVQPAVGLGDPMGRPTLTVMFFENRSSERELDWLCEGLSDMLITDLTRRNNVAVLSRGQLAQMFAQNGRDSSERITLNDALVIARTVKTTFVLTGAFVRIGDKVRIDVQLYDTSTGNLTGADSLTVERVDEILTQIGLLSLKVAARLSAGESPDDKGSLSRAMTDNLQAYRFYSLAVEKSQALHDQEAISLLEKAVELDPEFAMAHARIGYTYAVTSGLAEKGRPFLEKAFQLSSRLTEKDRMNISAWYAIAHLDYSAAITAFSEIISKYPTEVEAYWRLGRLYLGEEKYDDAVRVLKQGLVVAPDARDIHNALGVTYRDMGQHVDAVAATERYVLLAPDEPNAYDSLALAFQAAGRYDEALKAYDKALELNSKFEVATLHRANLYFQMGRYSDAITSYEKYISLAASNWDKAWGWGRIAWVHRAMGEMEKASTAAQREMQLDPDSFENSMMIAVDQGRSYNQFVERLKQQSKYNERGLRPSQRYFYYFSGRLALKEGRQTEAIASFQEALRHRPMIWDIDSFEDCLARAYAESGRFDEAIAEYNRILLINPNYPMLRFNLARAHEKKGSIDDARKQYELFLENWKDADPEIPELKAAKRFIASHA